MVVILTHFDAKLGPVNFYSIPEKFDDGKIIDQIVSLMNLTSFSDEILVNEFKHVGMKSFTMQVEINSSIARGGKESCQITVITRAEDAPMVLIEERLLEFKKDVQGNGDVYLAFNYNDEMHKVEHDSSYKMHPGVVSAHEFLVGVMKRLFDTTATGAPFTHGYISTMNKMHGKIAIPLQFQKEMERMLSSTSMESLFVVHRRDSDGGITIKIYPASNQGLTVRIVMKKLEPNQIARIAMLIPLKLLFTSGICRETRNKTCYYEAYFMYGKEDDYDQLKSSIESSIKDLEFVEDVIVSKINVMT